MKQNSMLAMILAGGRGSRLHDLTNKVAKPAVSYGGKYRIVDFPLSNCANSGIDVVGVLTQYESVELNSYVAAGGRWGLDSKNSGVYVLPPREKADAVTAQLLETALLACFNHGSLVTTAAKRITNEAGDIPVMEFGARRARGIDSSIEASKDGYIGGCCGTSNTYAGMKYDIPVLGTMAHSLVTEADDEYEAFKKYAESNPDNCVFLVDTYDTLKSGIPNAIKLADEFLTPNGIKFKGIRIDSGDLATRIM